MPDTLTEKHVALIAKHIAKRYAEAVADTFEPTGYKHRTDVLLDFAEVLAMSIRDSSLASELLGIEVTPEHLQSMQARCSFRPIVSE